MGVAGLQGSKALSLCAAGVYAFARVWMFGAATPLLTLDSRAYLSPEPSLLSSVFFSGDKPWFVPFFWRLAGDQVAPGTWAQIALSIAAWLFLAYEARESFVDKRLRVAAAIVPLLLSLSPVIAQWDAAVLSESLSLSFAAIVIALVLRLLKRPSRAVAASLVVAAACWAGTRDTNVYVVAALLPIAGVVLALRRHRALGGALAIAAVAILGFSLWSSSSPRRWELISLDLVDERVLSDPAALSYFKAHRMPDPPALRLRIFADRTPFSRFQTDPQLAPFRYWLLASSRTTYLGYLRDDPSARRLGLDRASPGRPRLLLDRDAPGAERIRLGGSHYLRGRRRRVPRRARCVRVLTRGGGEARSAGPGHAT